MSNSPDDRSPDESSTEPFWPFASSDSSGTSDSSDSSGGGLPSGSEDETQALGGAGADATQVHRRGDETRAQGGAGADATQVHRRGDETRVQPGGDETRVQPGEPEEPAPRWTARAGVPSPEDPGLRRPLPPQEWVGEEEDPYQGRAWYTPVIVGLVALVLVAALSVGLWLIYRATVNGENAPGGVVPPAASSAVPLSPSPAPSSAPSESSAAPSSEAPPSSSPPPALVAIPPLRGDTIAEATVKLQVLGLNVAVQRRPDASLPPGEVLGTQPGEGERVAPGTTVTLIVAAAPSPAPSDSVPGTTAAG